MKTQYNLKADVEKFYENINHEVLKQKLSKKFKDKYLLDYFYELIDSISTGPMEEVGIPIGNFCSQYFGNFYLSELDHFIKEKFHAKFYIRLMDDIVIFASNKKILFLVYLKIKKILRQIGLSIKRNWRIAPTHKGVDFNGYVFFHRWKLVRKRNKLKVTKLCRELSRKSFKNFAYTDFCRFQSYSGLIKAANSHRYYNKHMRGLTSKIRKYYYLKVKPKPVVEETQTT